MYLTLRSSDSKTYFPQNNGCHFKVLLAHPIELDDTWTVGLCELSLIPDGNWISFCSELYVHSNVGDSVFVGEHKERLLRRIVVGKEERSCLDRSFPSTYYVTVTVGELREVEISITDKTGTLVTELQKVKISVNLHLHRELYYKA
jgi:hypothetical protein